MIKDLALRNKINQAIGSKKFKSKITAFIKDNKDSLKDLDSDQQTETISRAAYGFIPALVRKLIREDKFLDLFKIYAKQVNLGRLVRKIIAKG